MNSNSNNDLAFLQDIMGHNYVPLQHIAEIIIRRSRFINILKLLLVCLLPILRETTYCVIILIVVGLFY